MQSALFVASSCVPPRRVATNLTDKAHFLSSRRRSRPQQHFLPKCRVYCKGSCRISDPSVSERDDSQSTRLLRSSDDLSSTSARHAQLCLAALLAASVLPAQPASALPLTTILFGPLFDPLVASSDFWVRALVWFDFRVAVAGFVVAPLVLFFWSFNAAAAETDAVKRVMVGYWQSSSLLMLTVFLNIANVPVAAFTGLFVQALIPFTLLWWTDLLEEINSDDGALSRAFRAWRWPAVVAAGAGVLAQVPFQGCNFVKDVASDNLCAPWLEPPHAFHQLLIPNVPPESLQYLAYGGIAIYFSYLVWLVTNVLPKCGRSGRKDRNTFSSVSALKFFGLIDKNSPGN